MHALQEFMSTKVLSTRAGTVATGAFAALLAGLVLLVYLKNYRDSVASGHEPVPVLIARSLIEKGTSGSAIAATNKFQVVDTPRDQLKEGAISDPAVLNGRVATSDIYPNQQLTSTTFSAGSTTALGTRLVKSQRAITVPIDAAHGMIGHIESGDRVDVYASFNLENSAGGAPGGAKAVLKILLQNILVLDAPTSGGGGVGGATTANVVLRMSPQDAAKVAFTADNGKVWLVLSPRNGARVTKPSIITVSNVLLGKPPLSFGN